MIESLVIEGLGVIDTAEIEPCPGLTVLTGETGAGKTMVLSGLSLVLGNRPDPGQVRRGAVRAAATAVVHLEPDDPALGRVADAGGQADNGALVLVRTVSPEGRSRAHAGGTTVPAALLGEIAERLVTVHGQADQRRLLRGDRQRELLDAYADRLSDGPPPAPPQPPDRSGRRRAPADGPGAGEPDGARLSPLVCYRSERASWVADLESLDALVTGRAAREREAEVLRHGVAEIEAADPRDGEDLLLADEQDGLSHAETVGAAVQAARDALSADRGVTDLLSVAVADLDRASTHHAGLRSAAERVREVAMLARELAVDLSSELAGLEPDPARLAEIGSRRDLLARLARRWSPAPGTRPDSGSPDLAAGADGLSGWLADARDRLAVLDQDDAGIVELRARCETGRALVTTAAAALTEHRQAAADALAAGVSAELAALAMPRAIVSVHLDPVLAAADDPVTVADGSGRLLRAGAHGTETVELRLAPHPGAPARALDEGASGGELSRVMLAVEVVAADAAPTPTFVFDEIDAGIGGATALEVGRRLARLARRRQVLAVTHLAQVAVYADRHFAVTKDSLGAVMRSGVRAVDGDERVAELARMLGGHAESGAARTHVTELLDQARRDALEPGPEAPPAPDQGRQTAPAPDQGRQTAPAGRRSASAPGVPSRTARRPQ